ncbi:unnamed protein product [Schistosoma curassoni]|uniref:MULE domain-containing protein n=1 Tax=Schistosoma curassoni TaxID=6186 RepID=A0A183KR05_9TREM|nr:unnamed protein product [Schistosoma curassoni]
MSTAINSSVPTPNGAKNIVPDSSPAAVRLPLASSVRQTTDATSNQKDSTKVPICLIKLVRSIVRTFYSREHSLIVDMLIGTSRSDKHIGFSIVEKRLELYRPSEEWDVFLTGDHLSTNNLAARSLELGQEAVKRPSNKGLDVKFHQVNMMDRDGGKAFLTFVGKNYPNGITIAVNNAEIAYKVVLLLLRISIG